VKVGFRALPAQRSFCESDAAFPGLVGGYGSGKSQALAMRALHLLVRDRTDIAYYMPTYDLVRLVGFRRLRELLMQAGMPFKANATNFSIEVESFGSVIFRTMEDPDRLVGYEVGHSLCDELDTLPTAKAEVIWQRVLARNRSRLPSGRRNTAAVGTTPEGFRFVYERWGRDEAAARAAGYVLFRARTADNRHLPPDYVANLRAQYPSNLLEAYLNGEFVNLSDGLVQRQWFRRSTLDREQVRHACMGVDLAISLKAAADSSALVVGGLVDGVFHVLHAASKKGTFHEVQQWVIQQAEAWAPRAILIEAVQYQLAAVQELMRTTRLPVMPARPDKDKASRLMPLAARYEQGMVHHAPAHGGNAIKALEDELTAFPNGAHDDLVDALVYAWQGADKAAGSGFASGGGRRTF
jgi:predicted phage terminase large subunit-like protein